MASGYVRSSKPKIVEHNCAPLKSPSGQTMVEFAIVIPIFLLLVFGIMEFARLFFVQDNVERAVAATARYASIGTHESGTDPSTGKPYTRVKSIKDYLQQQASETKP